MASKPANEDELLQMIEDCENRETKMSEWEQQFIDSISIQVGRGNALTGKQVQTLERIWNRVTD
jgi:hypothetical protein